MRGVIDEEAEALYARGYRVVTLGSDSVLLTQHGGVLVTRFRQTIEAV